MVFEAASEHFPQSTDATAAPQLAPPRYVKPDPNWNAAATWGSGMRPPGLRSGDGLGYAENHF